MSWTVADVMLKDAASVEHAVDLAASSVATTTPATSLAYAASLMFQHRIQQLPVVDDENRPVGIVSRTQLLKVFLRSDELIRREIVRILRDATRSRSRLEVEVRAGLATLSGEIEEESIGRLLIERIANLPGVVGVKNELKPAQSDATE